MSAQTTIGQTSPFVAGPHHYVEPHEDRFINPSASKASSPGYEETVSTQEPCPGAAEVSDAPRMGALARRRRELDRMKRVPEAKCGVTGRARLAYSFIRYLIVDTSEANVNIDPKLLTIIVGALEKAMKETVGSVSAPAAAMLAMLSTIGGLLTIAGTQRLQQQSSSEK